nr:hypothetical protein [uncultured Friedmanniella sp.]
MASWEDGPEYAPLERPAQFTTPAAAPLDDAEPVVEAAPTAPVQRPQFRDPAEPVAPLSTLVPVVEDPRDPQVPFDVVTTNLTSGSAWGSAHGGLPPPVAPPVAAGALPASAYSAESLLQAAAAPTDAWPPAAPRPGGYPPAAPGAYPAPGTPQWFGPGPYGEQPPAPRVDLRRFIEAATPGLLIVLGVGGLIFVLSPVLLAVAFSLRSRVRAAEPQVRLALGVALGMMIFFGVIGLSRQPLDFSEWWSFVGAWSLLLCWATLVTVCVLVYRGLKHDPAAPSSYPNPWR